MFMDKLNEFSDNQAVTGSAPSAESLDIANTDLGSGEPIQIFATVTEDFATCTSVKITLQQSDTENFASSTELVSSRAVPVAELKAGFRFSFGSLPPTNGNYLRAYYTVSGSNATTGKITCALVLDKESGR